MSSATVDSVGYWPVMGRLSVALGYGVQYRLWLMLLDGQRQGDGCGWVECNWRQLGELAGVTPATAKRQVIAGDGLYWRRSRRRLYITGQVALAARLAALAASRGLRDAYELERRQCVMDREIVYGADTARFFSELFAGWIDVARGERRRITWSVLQDAWHRSRPTLLTWLDLAGIDRQHNLGRVEIDRAADIDEIAETYPTFSPESHFWYAAERGSLYLCWQRGNTYSCASRRGVRGQARAIRRAVYELACAALLAVDGGDLAAGGLQANTRLLAGSGGLTALLADVRAGRRYLLQYERLNYEDWGAFWRAVKRQAEDSLYMLADRFVTGSAAWGVWNYQPSAGAAVATGA